MKHKKMITYDIYLHNMELKIYMKNILGENHKIVFIILCRNSEGGLFHLFLIR